MSNVIPFGSKPERRARELVSGQYPDVDPRTYYSQGTALLHQTFDRLAAMDTFGAELPKDRLIEAAHHAVDLQDEVYSLEDFREHPASEEAERLREMATRLGIVDLADYISSLTTHDAHRTPQRVMTYTSVYIDRIPLLLEP